MNNQFSYLVHQLNTGKSSTYLNDKPLSLISMLDFKHMISTKEGLHADSIVYVRYKPKTKFQNWNFKTENMMMDRLYTNNVIEYFAVDKKIEMKSNLVCNYSEDVTKAMVQSVRAKFPFSLRAPKWCIAFLWQNNNWKTVKEVIKHTNKECQNQERIGCLQVQDFYLT